MIRCYFLPVETVDGTEQVAGIEFIHDALLLGTPDPLVRCLIQDTTQAEHDLFVVVALTWRLADAEEVTLYHDCVIIIPPSPDYIRACEILSNPNLPIPAPDLAELLRIFGRRLGYDF